MLYRQFSHIWYPLSGGKYLGTSLKRLRPHIRPLNNSQVEQYRIKRLTLLCDLRLPTTLRALIYLCNGRHFYRFRGKRHLQRPNPHRQGHVFGRLLTVKHVVKRDHITMGPRPIICAFGYLQPSSPPAAVDWCVWSRRTYSVFIDQLQLIILPSKLCKPWRSFGRFVICQIRRC